MSLSVQYISKKDLPITSKALRATVQSIENEEQLHIVTFECFGHQLQMMSLDLPYKVETNSQVYLSIKPTSIGIGKDIEGRLSYSNQLDATIQSIKLGILMCHLELLLCHTQIEVIITKKSFDKLQLEVGDRVVALIKASEVSISKVLQND